MGAAHTVQVTARYDEDTELTPQVVFMCGADTRGDCHWYPDCDCESWTFNGPVDQCGHPRIEHAECWIAPWFDAECHTYAGDDADYETGDFSLPAGLTRSGEVDVSFQSDYVEWWWAA